MTPYKDRLDAGHYTLGAAQDEAEATDIAATAAAETKAAELGVDLAAVEGTGKGGKVTVPDVEAAAGQ